MTAVPPPVRQRAGYSAAALENASDDLARRNFAFRAVRAYYEWSLQGSYAQRAFLLATAFVASKSSALRPILEPVAIIQAVFIVLSWIGRPIIDVFLCLDSSVRRLIPPWRRSGALLTGATLAAAVAFTIPASITEKAPWLFAAFCTWAMLFPASAVFRLPAGPPRTIQTTALIAFIGCTAAATMLADDFIGKALVGFVVIGCIISARAAVGPIAANPLNRR